MIQLRLILPDHNHVGNYEAHLPDMSRSNHWRLGSQTFWRSCGDCGISMPHMLYSKVVNQHTELEHTPKPQPLPTGDKTAGIPFHNWRNARGIAGWVYPVGNEETCTTLFFFVPPIGTGAPGTQGTFRNISHQTPNGKGVGKIIHSSWECRLGRDMCFFCGEPHERKSTRNMSLHLIISCQPKNRMPNKKWVGYENVNLKAWHSLKLK